MQNFLRYSIWLHRMLRMVAVIAMILFVVSALMHPIMIWTGPQAVRMQPPSVSIDHLAVNTIQKILNEHAIDSPLLVRLVPTEFGVALQVTEKENSPRRYFNLVSRDEMQAFDSQQAVWLSRYYTDRKDAIESVEFITEFNDEYPWVNRLLPVYKVTFDSSDSMVVYVHTETSAMAAVNNGWKNALQFVFRNFHTWSWLDEYPLVRVTLVTVLLTVLILVWVSGVIQLLLRRPTAKTPHLRKQHRFIAWIIFVPIIALLLSGMVHLQFQQFGKNQGGMRMSAALQMEDVESKADFSKIDQHRPINNISLITYQGRLFYRVGFAPEGEFGSTTPGEHGHSKKIKRFNGIAVERSSVYINFQTGEQAELNDEMVVRSLAEEYMWPNTFRLGGMETIFRFGPEYDFRNKRLPVWRVETIGEDPRILFVDPVTSTLVDSLTISAQTERWIFSNLHKWDFLVPFAGRQWRDVIVVALLIGLLLLAYVGFSLTTARKD